MSPKQLRIARRFRRLLSEAKDAGIVVVADSGAQAIRLILREEYEANRGNLENAGVGLAVDDVVTATKKARRGKRQPAVFSPFPKEGDPYEAFKLACSKVATEIVHIPDLLDESDPYEAFEEMRACFDAGETPEECIRHIFAEDLARQEHDEQQYNEALEHEFDESDHGD